MARRKLQRFAFNEQAKNFLEEGKPLFNDIKGKWHSEFFKNNFPITLELACGRGEYTVGLATLYPSRNFVGVDIKGSRMWKASHHAIENQMDNIGLLRTTIDFLDRFFAKDEVEELWITFPDPRLKEGTEHRRLTHPRYLDIYRKVLKSGGIVNFKTDNQVLFEWTLEVLKEQNIEILNCSFDLYNSPERPLAYDIQTTYEKKFLPITGRIYFVRFKLD
ncbi:MAG: tRNA (guanosine(46)-N7)-methyltransferase TrmB [Cytophagales bacterium]|nr:tRNA (guanosine(46)-N7)-methyltransferase TrmB [Cytophagales bacterium]